MSFFPNLRDAFGTFLWRFSRLADKLGARSVALATSGFGYRIRAHDPMTGVLTQLEFRRRVGARWHELDGATALLFDVDGIGFLNHALGHLAGDACLVEIANLVVGGAEGALVCRLGGDKFVVLVLEAAQAERIAERIRTRIQQSFQSEREAVASVHPDIGKRPLLTFSVGAAKIGPGLSLTQVLERCVEAMWAAKADGRNRLCWAPHRCA